MLVEEEAGAVQNRPRCYLEATWGKGNPKGLRVFGKMARPAGLEPATSGSEAQRSIH